MSVNVSNLKVKFSDLKYEQLLADKYFVETCFSKKFDSRPQRELVKDLYLKIKTFNPFCDGATTVDCHLPQTGCDALGNSTTTTTTLPE
jgi:hypothetical protein